MKRGLVRHEPSESQRAEHARRIDALRARVREAGCDIALVYGDVSRSDDVAYLGGICIYWNEGILAVPVQGDVAFVTKLSPRVHPWMRATSTVADLLSGPDMPGLVAGVLEDRGLGASGRVGLVEGEWWPAGLLGALGRALPQAELVDLGDVVRAARRRPDPTELDRLRRAGAVAGEATAAAVGLDDSPTARIGAVERRVRGAGLTDVFATVALAADGTVSASAVVQDGHLWLRAARSAGGPLAEHAAAGADRAVEMLIADWRAVSAPNAPALVGGWDGAAIVAAAGRDAPEGVSVTASCVRHADLFADGQARSGRGDDGGLTVGDVVVVSVTASAERGGSAMVADTYFVGEHGVVSLSDAAEAAR